MLSKFPGLNTQQNADDVFQETCFALMKKLENFDPARGAKLSTFIGMIAKNAAYDFARKQGRQARLHSYNNEEEEFARAASPVANPEQSLRRKELTILLLAAREKLPPFLQEAMDYNLAGNPEDTAAYAEAKGISETSVFTRRSKMVAKLRKAMAKHAEMAALEVEDLAA